MKIALSLPYYEMIKKLIKNSSSWFSKKIRLVGMHPETFEEHWRIVVSRFNLISLFFLLSIVAFGIFYLVVFYSPFSRLLPQQEEQDLRQELLEHHERVRDYEQTIAQQRNFIENFQKVILGELSIDSIFLIEDDFSTVTPNLDTTRQRAEMLLSEEVTQREIEIPSEQTNRVKELFLMDPIVGEISQSFHPERHKAVDIVAHKNASVFACLDGVVIHAGYDDADGWMVIIKHPNEILSVYKHLNKLSVQTGDFVRTGEVLGLLGSSGSRSTGPHLHFELWSPNGPLNPLDYLSFGK